MDTHESPLVSAPYKELAAAVKNMFNESVTLRS
jgi:hypothetical protein